MITYVRSPAVKVITTSEPVPVTYEMVEDIRRRIIEEDKLPLAPTTLLQYNALNQIMRNLHLQSEGKKVTPELWGLVVDKVIQRWMKARIKVGRPVAILGSEAWISNVMQMTLNTFHHAGAATNTGFKATYELMHVPVNRSVNHVYLHFNTPMTRRDVFMMRSKLVYRSLDNFLLDYEIEPFKNFYPSSGPHFWQIIHMAANGININPDYLVLRLKFNISELITYRVSLRDIAEKIKSRRPNLIYIMYSPMKDGIIDVYYPDIVPSNTAISSEHNIRIFYRNYVIPDFSNIHMSGIKGIYNLYVATSEIPSAIYRIKKLSKIPNFEGLPSDMVPGNTYFEVNLRRDTMRYDGVSLNEFKRYTEACGGKLFTTNPIDNEYVIVSFPGDISEKQAFTGKFDDPDGTITEHTYAILDSVSLQEVLKLPFCDIDRTYSNNYHIMSHVFGIEMARDFHCYDSMRMIEMIDTSTNSHHVTSFSDIVTQRGVFKGIGSGGIAKEDTGFMSRSSISEPHKIIPAAAIFDNIGESVLSTSAAIAVGQLPKLGTGVTDYGVDFNFDEVDLTGEDLEKVVINIGEIEEAEPQIIEQIFDSAQSPDDIDDISMFNPGYISVKTKMLRIDDKSGNAPPKKPEVSLSDRSYITLDMIDKLTPPIYGKGIPLQTLNLMYNYMKTPIDVLLGDLDLTKEVQLIPRPKIVQGEPSKIDLTKIVAYLQWYNLQKPRREIGVK